MSQNAMANVPSELSKFKLENDILKLELQLKELEINKQKRFVMLVCDYLHHSSIISNTRADKVFEIYYDINEAINL